jgi:hypothetical protein
MYGINRDTVIKLASIRGSEWKTFRFGDMDISYVNKPDNNIPEDEVITRNEKGEYIMVGMQNYNATRLSNNEHSSAILIKAPSTLFISQ